MATAGLQISIKDRTTAMQWLSMVEEINQAYNAAMTEASQTLQDVQNFADGTMVDEFVNLGDTLLRATQQTYEAIGAISELVVNVLDIVEDFKEAATDFVKSAVRNIFG